MALLGSHLSHFHDFFIPKMWLYYDSHVFVGSFGKNSPQSLVSHVNSSQFSGAIKKCKINDLGLTIVSKLLSEICSYQLNSKLRKGRYKGISSNALVIQPMYFIFSGRNTSECDVCWSGMWTGMWTKQGQVSNYYCLLHYQELYLIDCFATSCIW